MLSKLHQGFRIERDAEAFLLSQTPGARWVISRNFRCRGGEIDLVLEERVGAGELELVFVEVRFRASDGWVDGAESVDWLKRKRLRRAIQRFLQSYRGRAESVRVDVLARNGWVWDYLKNVRIDE